LIEKKGLRTSLRAFAKFVALYPRSTITIAGEGPLLRELQEWARELKIDNGAGGSRATWTGKPERVDEPGGESINRVSFTGFISQGELREIFYASHIFLHPSEIGSDGNQEGVPNSMLEAMASGLPAFATQHGGIPEAIEDGVSGVLVPERDHEALARALLDAAQDRHLLSRLARSGAKAVAEKFDQRVQIQKLEEIYLKTIDVL